ncbi:hypothetical protein ORI20_05565 [Mycobacterium sp. CVI_P3]|uniref:Uncharacterized protein n=1 Tax=Mycobacterium pinniadriaticum TaxID=2994102 RepID=A0ABT3S9F4_9MYCO|nr:hypothetical protein [Mycobacterium pinniadriaticum]MCX2929730.1 hypothetical protein [Mycobacterium pinniadriaticum]MCX2936154.1 hypothetical protein [Mycobacterium pinniadriaticum]
MTPSTRGLVAGAVIAIANIAVTIALGAGTAGAATMPAEGTYIADMTSAGENPMTMAVTVDGDKVAAYATNGTDEEAWFFGTQTAGTMHLTSMYADRIDAVYDGSQLSGTVTMNDGGTSRTFSAPAVAAPAGIYTATMGGTRASWVVRPNRTMMGVMDNSAPGDHKVTDQLAAEQQQYRDQVRQMRIDQQMRQAPPMRYGTWSATIDATPVTATRVTGGMRF